MSFLAVSPVYPGSIPADSCLRKPLDFNREGMDSIYLWLRFVSAGIKSIQNGEIMKDMELSDRVKRSPAIDISFDKEEEPTEVRIRHASSEIYFVANKKDGTVKIKYSGKKKGATIPTNNILKAMVEYGEVIEELKTLAIQELREGKEKEINALVLKELVPTFKVIFKEEAFFSKLTEQAMMALVDIGEFGVLGDIVEEKESPLRRRAIETLRKAKAPETLQGLKSSFRGILTKGDDSFELQEQAVLALVDIEDFDFLLEDIIEKAKIAPELKEQAILALGETKKFDMLNLIIEDKAKDIFPAVKKLAIQELRKGKAYSHLEKLSSIFKKMLAIENDFSSDSLGGEVVLALVDIDEFDILLEAISKKRFSSAGQIILVLGGEQKAFNILETIIEDKKYNKKVKKQAIMQLEKSNAVESLERLFTTLRSIIVENAPLEEDRDAIDLVKQTMTGLGYIGRFEPLRDMIKSVNDMYGPNPELISHAIWVLRKKETVDALKDLRVDDNLVNILVKHYAQDYGTFGLAKQAIMALGDVEEFDYLERLIRENVFDDPTLVEQAIVTLGDKGAKVNLEEIYLSLTREKDGELKYLVGVQLKKLGAILPVQRRLFREML
jgi:hypothetical protein